MEHTICINAKAFIIPNPASKLREFADETKKEYFRGLATINNIELNNNDKMVQLWLHDKEELKLDNLCRHPTKIKIADGREIRFQFYELENFPAKLLEGVKENDVVKYKVPYVREIFEKVDGELKEITDLKIILDITMTCQQQGYRYMSFGNFEDVVSYVTK